MESLSRRSLLAGALGAASELLAGCGGDGSGGTNSVNALSELVSGTPAPPPPPPTPAAPAWSARVQSATWIEVPMGGTLAAINPINNAAINPNYPAAPEWAPNTLSFDAVVTAWCGAAFNESASEMWVGIHGGHTSYAGNEVMACDFSSETPTWRLVRKPSGAIGNVLNTDDGQEARGTYSDGRPRSIHTAGKWCYVPGVGPALMALGGGAWQPARGGKNWSVFVDERTGEAAYTSELANVGLTDNAGTCYDPTRHAIWLSIRNRTLVTRYNIPASGGVHQGRFTEVGRDDPGYGNQNLCYLPGHDCLLVGDAFDDESVSRWRVMDCKTGEWFRPSFNGVLNGPRSVGSGQLRWVPSLGAACFWDNATQTTLITKVTPGVNARTDPWTIGSLPVSGSNAVNPSARQGNGTYGRFAYAPALGGFLLFNSVSGPTYFYKI